MKSHFMLAAIHRGLHCLPKCLFKEKQNYFKDFKSGPKLRHIPNTYRRVPFVLNLCMLSNVFCPEYFLNLTDLSPSGPARRFAEPDLGLNCLYDQFQTFSF